MNNDKNFKPYVPADKVMPEFTITSIILGALLAVIFGGANAYLKILRIIPIETTAAGIEADTVMPTRRRS